ncbi:MAG: protein of unknown function DUF2523 [Inoviridae sp.]|nr:MAG: protein of unknown function DUF2523 [Inoviridae sp.]
MNWIWMGLSALAPYFIRFIGASLVSVVSSIGVGFITFTGLNSLIDHVISKLQGSLTGLPNLIVNFISLTGIDTAVNICLSAAFALMMLKGMSKVGSLTNQVWRKPSSKISTGSWDA